jgi:hypothetical protein
MGVFTALEFRLVRIEYPASRAAMTEFHHLPAIGLLEPPAMYPDAAKQCVQRVHCASLLPTERY